MKTRLATLLSALLLSCNAAPSWAQAIEVLHRFEAAPPWYPNGPLVRGTGDWLYGTSVGGGTFNNAGGTVFRVNAAGDLEVLHSFSDEVDGSWPLAGLLRASDGWFYGTTSQGGGQWSAGTIFRINEAGDFQTIHVFTGLEEHDPNTPNVRLIQASDGFIYGATAQIPIIFRINPVTLAYEEVHRFSEATEGGQPSELFQASDGYLYGTLGQTIFVHPPGYVGAVFRMDLTGQVTIVHRFVEGGGGPHLPVTGLIQGTDGYFYGLDIAGLMYRMDFQGNVTTALDDPILDSRSYFGFDQVPGLILGPDGHLYGATQSSVFRVEISGNDAQLVELKRFDYDSPNHNLGLAIGVDGLLYGSDSGPGLGSIYRISIGGAFETVRYLSVKTGANPSSALATGPDGRLYGATQVGGRFDLGTIYRLEDDGSVTSIHDFAPGQGFIPYSQLLAGSDGKLYGTTLYGGDNFQGTVFRVTTDGGFEQLHSFGDVDGLYPQGGLTEVAGSIYGTASGGGSGGWGVVFRIDPQGTFEVLHNFTASTDDGGDPGARLLLAPDGFLYGVTRWGGATNHGTFFRMSLAGDLTILRSFFCGDGSQGACYPNSLMQASNGWFYGTTREGSNPGSDQNTGTVFRIDTNGNYENFPGFQGSYAIPNEPTLFEADDHLLYGVTHDGFDNDGSVFRLGQDGSFTTVVRFGVDGSTERTPLGPLVKGSDGKYYGVTEGASNGGGVLFRVELVSTTPVGDDVEVQPIDTTTGTAPVNLTFDAIVEPGTTSVTTSTTTSAPPPPGTFNLGDTPVYFEVETTAVFAGSIDVCFSYTAVSVPDPASARLLHYNGTEWEDVTTSNDPVGRLICGSVTSLSPFVIGSAAATGYEVEALFDQAKVYKAGSTIPIRIRVLSDGVNVSAPALAVVATGIRRKSLDTAWGTPEDPGQSNPDSNFTYQLVDDLPGYRFNLKTASSYQGTYELKMRVGTDSTELIIEFQVR